MFKRTLTALLSSAVALAPAIASAQSVPADAPTVNSGGGANSASLVLPFGKSAIIDLPADARDVLISNPRIADAVIRTSRRAYVIGRALGSTNIFFFDAAGRQVANIEIRVEPDVSALNQLLLRHAPDGNIHAEAVNASVVLSGTVRNPADSDRAAQIAAIFLGIAGGEGAGDGGTGGDGPRSPGTQQPGGNEPRVINLIQVQGSEQVLVRVRVVEMSRTLVRQLGINLSSSEVVSTLVDDDDFLNLATASGFAVNGGILGGLTATATHQDGADSSDATLQAFERAGLLRMLAEPNLTAISGEAARFLAGGEFPVPVSSDDGQISVEFKPFGVGLAFTPIVLSGGRISLKLSTEVSELTSEGAISTGDTPIRNQDGTTTVIRGITIPALQVRRAETTLEMPSGGSIVMAGLIQERTRQAMEGVPGVMNTPVIGSLFRSRDFINNETELVVIVTPYLVNPTSPDRLRTPADGYMNASEAQSLFTGRLNAMYRDPEQQQGDDTASLQGPHGHVIE